MGYLRDGVDAGIRPAGAVDFEVGSQEVLGGLAELTLHGPGVVLLLPAAVLGSVIFKGELPGFQFLSLRPRAVAPRAGAMMSVSGGRPCLKSSKNSSCAET